MPRRQVNFGSMIWAWIQSIPFASILTVFFLCYLTHSLYSIYQIYYPAPCPVTEVCLYPSWTKNSKFHVSAFVSASKQFRSGTNLKLIWSEENFDLINPTVVNVNVTLPQETIRNGSLFLHLCFTDESHASKKYSLKTISHYDFTMTSTKSAPITKYVLPKTKAFNLLEAKHSVRKPDSTLKQKLRPETHWIQKLTVHVMSEALPISSISPEMFSHFQINKMKKYLPLLFVDHFGLLEKDFYPVNSSNSEMPLSITFTPVNFGKMRMILTVDYSLKILEKYGFSEKDTDDVKAVFFDTNIYLLFVTFIVSGFHLLFDVLSFKNDISFWRQRKTNVGVSFRSLVWRCVSQSIIFLYLYDQGTSSIVLVPAGISICIELWKVTKTLKLKLVRRGWWYSIQLGTYTEEEKVSDSYDSQGMKYLTWVILPCCLIYASYTLFFEQHTSWFSWCIESVVNGVYAFGFIFMMPQLFVNYKLKSVAHLPLRAFMYKAFNTVVDDLFAFIISMPTAHRVACFRDDIVFVIYLYQRYLYPVDTTRPSEYSATEEQDRSKAKKD